MARQKRVDHPVPYTLTEWDRVSSLLKSPNLVDMEESLKYLSMWCTRMGSATPIAITCTAMCLHAAIKEKKMTHPMELEELKLLISITIIRFINYISEAKRTGSDSIYSLAEKAGIPAWVVDIRHNASHLHLPSIGALKRSLDVCRLYLYREFWSKSMHEAIVSAIEFEDGEDVEECSEKTLIALKTRQAIVKALNEFISFQFKNLTLKDYSNCVPLRNMRKLMVSDAEIFMSIFVSEGFFFLNKEQARNLGIRIGARYTIPHHLKLLWKPAMTGLIEFGLYTTFLTQIFNAKIIASESGNENIEHQATSWAIDIIQKALTKDQVVFKAEEWSLFLSKIVQAPDGFNTSMVEKIMAKVPNVDTKFRRHVRQMMEISLSESLMEDDYLNDTQIHTAADLERLIKQNNKKPVANKKCGLFTLIDSTDEIPMLKQLGLFRGQRYETISLVLDDEWLAAADIQSKRDNLMTIEEDDLESQGTTFYADTTVYD